MPKIKVAIIGSGNIGTDLMIKITQTSPLLEVSALVGIDPESDGLKRAKRMGIPTTDKGIDGLLSMKVFASIDIVFDATSASAHQYHNDCIIQHGKQMIDLTPAAIGPFTVPVVNIEQHLHQPNINMVTCGGQATIPMVAAVSRVATVHYAEIIASVSSRSAGPGTRQNIDEFTLTTSKGIEIVGGAKKGKAIIILNPAEPPMIMRNTVFTLSDIVDEQTIISSVKQMCEQVRSYVPGYRLKQEVQFDYFADRPLHIPGYGDFIGMKSSIFLEVEGAAHYLPAYAGNLDIMTSAAMGCAHKLVDLKLNK